MTASNIPSGFSQEDLEELMASAKQEAELRSEKVNDENTYSEENVTAVASKFLDEMGKEVPGPLVHKVAALQIIERMYDWHMTMAKKELDDGDERSASCWYKDAGHFQVIFNTLLHIGVGPEDFTLPIED